MKLSSTLSALILALVYQGAQSQSLRQAGKEAAGIATESNADVDAHTVSRGLSLVQSSGLSWDVNSAFGKGPGFEFLVGLGNKVAITGDGTFMAAAPEVTPESDYEGLVRFYRKNSTDGWEYIESLTLNGTSEGDAFGAAIALGYNGTLPTVAIGAYGDDGQNNVTSQSGSVSIYKMQPDMVSWEFVQIIHGEAAFDNS
eukprot:scaffold3198_cov109-Cylindrotheca_fusiformis.AAC.1